MAEFGAHLTSAAKDNQPSFFEVLAQESLMVTLRPALTYFLKVLAENQPQKFGLLLRWSDEAYSMMDFILQHHFLTKTSASFSENFYSLKRVPTRQLSSSRSIFEGLPKRELWKSLMLLVLVPYIKLKLDALCHYWTEESLTASDRGRHTMRRYKRLFLVLYPYIHCSWESAVLMFQLRYLFKQTQIHSPFLKLAGVELQYLSREDMEQLAKDAGRITLPTDSSGKDTMVYYLKRLVGALVIAISSGLSMGVFFLQFLEWWYVSEEHQSAMAATSLPIPQPPKEREPEYCQILLPRDVSLCPLCQKKRTNDTTILTSGYVFCYPCIFAYIKKHQRCPVTRYPTNTSHFIKLYPPDR